MGTYFIGVDLGTTGIKAGIIDLRGNTIVSSCWETALSSSGAGRMEQNPDDFYHDTLQIIRKVLEKSGIHSKNVAGIAMDGQMGGVIGIDKDFNSLTGLDMGLDIKSEKYNAYIHEKYGELISKRTCGSPRNAPKIIWWKKEQPDIYCRIFKFVTLSGYVAGKVTGLTHEDAFIDHTLLSFLVQMMLLN